MAGLLESLLSGRSSDIYGEGLLTPEQRGGLGNIGLLALAGKLGQLAGPSFSPVPDFGAALGQAAGAYGASQEGAGTAALNAILTGQKGRKLQSELDYAKQSGPYFDKIIQALAGLSPGGGAESSGSTGGGAAASPSAGGGGGGGGSVAAPAEYAELIKQAAAKENVDPAVLTSLISHESSFNPNARGSSGEIGLGQFMPGTAASLGINPANPTQAIFGAARYLRQGLDAHGNDYTMALRYYNGGPGGVNKPQTLTYANTVLGGARRAGAAPTAAAPAPAGGGGLLNLPQVPNFARDQLGGGTVPLGVNIGPTAAPGQGASEEPPPGFAGRQLVAQLGAGAPLADVSQFQQVAGPGGGDAPGGMASGLLAPGGPLTRGGVPGLPAPPPAATPSADPSLQLGPLAPAPAAAAPAAAGPGLLAPPGAPAAALPRGVNPAYGQVATAIAAAALQASRAGMPTAPFELLLRSLESNPAYKSEIKRGEAQVGLEFAGPMKDAEKAVELRYSEAIAAAVSRGNLPGQIILKNIEAQNDLRNKLASGPVPMQISFDKDGVGTLTPIQGGAEAGAAAEALKPTETQRNYDAYVKDAQMRNQPVLSRIDWERTKGQPDPERAARIALDLKAAEPLAAQAAAGREARPLLDEVVRIAYQTPEGMAGEGGAAVGKAMSAFGFSPTARMSNAELLSAMQQRLIGPIQLSGTTSDRDVTRYLAATPGLMSTGDGRVKMAEMTKALIDRNIELAEVYRSNLGALDLSQKLAAVHNKPLFTDEQRALIDETIRTRGGTVPGGTPSATGVPGAAPGTTPRIRDFNPATGTFGAPR